MTIGERIKRVRKTLDLTQQEFADQLRMKRNSIAQVEGGRSTSEQTIFVICKTFNVSETWLRTGEGEMFEPEETDAWEEVVKRRGLSGSDRLLIEKFMNLKPTERDVVMKYVVSVAADYTTASTVAPAPADTRSRDEKPVKDWTDEDIEADVAEYRRHLLDEKEQAVKSSALQSSNGSGAKLA